MCHDSTVEYNARSVAYARQWTLPPIRQTIDDRYRVLPIPCRSPAAIAIVVSEPHADPPDPQSSRLRAPAAPERWYVFQSSFLSQRVMNSSEALGWYSGTMWPAPRIVRKSSPCS